MNRNVNKIIEPGEIISKYSLQALNMNDRTSPQQMWITKCVYRRCNCSSLLHEIGCVEYTELFRQHESQLESDCSKVLSNYGGIL